MDNQPELNKIKLPMPRIDNAFPYSNLLEYFEAEATRQHIEKVKAIKAELESKRHDYYKGCLVIRQEEFESVFAEYLKDKE